MISVCKLNFDELKVYAEKVEKAMTETEQEILITGSKEILEVLDATAKKEFLIVKYIGNKLENLGTELEFVKIPKCKNFFMLVRRCPEFSITVAFKLLQKFDLVNDKEQFPSFAVIEENSDGEYEVDYLINLDEQSTEVLQDKFVFGDI